MARPKRKNTSAEVPSHIMNLENPKDFFCGCKKKLLYNVFGFSVNSKCQRGIIVNYSYIHITSLLNWINLALQRDII